MSPVESRERNVTGDASATVAGNEVRLTIGRREGKLTSRQWLPLAQEELFGFFGDAYNLEEITPTFLRFRVLTVSTPEVRRGTIIRYRLSLHGLPLWWRTVIDRWEPPVCFTDRQESGPFRLWVHDHEFIPQDGGTLIVDRVRFRARFHRLLKTPLLGWIRRDLERIFTYRQEVIAQRFRRIGSNRA